MDVRRIAIVCVAVLSCGGCGGSEPLLDPGTADPLAKQADAIAARIDAGDACGARDRAVALQRRAIAAINAGRIPGELQEPLQSRVNELVSELEPECLPSVAPESIPQPPVTRDEPSPPSGKWKKHRGEKPHGRGKGHKKHKGHGD